MPNELVHYAATNGVGTITLDSPHNRNALSTELMRQLLAVLDAAGADHTVRVVVLGHAGPVFCSGMDLRESGGRQAAEMPVQAFPLVMQTIWESPKPVIARVGGPARAGGIGLLASCDIAVTTPEATFAFSEVRLGLVPAVITPAVLTRVPLPVVRELYLTGETFDGTRAAAIGLANAAVDDVDAEVARYADLLRRGGPSALAGIKRLLHQPPGVAELADVVGISAQFFAAEEGQEGMAAFREKRPPRWVSG